MRLKLTVISYSLTLTMARKFRKVLRILRNVIVVTLVSVFVIKYFNDLVNGSGTKTTVYGGTIVVGFVSCDKPGTNVTLTLGGVLMKSALISAAFNKVSVISFHIFLEIMERQTHFESILKGLDYPRDKLRVELHFYSVLKAVPERYHEAMIYIKKRCAFVRLFMPSNLPNDDAILYLDTDNIVTGNIKNVWGRFQEMNERQLIGVAPAVLMEDEYNDKILSACFGDIPYVPPKGVNSGVLLMNLTKMRSYGWENKVLEIFNNYSKIADLFGDQKIINILLHFERDLLKLIPCHYNYVHIFCDNGQNCTEAESDPNGIEILHGAGGQYISERFQLYEVFRMYRDFTGSHKDVYEQLMVPLRQYYENPRGSSRCFGSLNRLLFKSYYETFR